MEIIVYVVGAISIIVGFICFIGSDGTFSVKRGYIPGIVYTIGAIASFRYMAIWPVIAAFAINWILAAITNKGEIK